MTQRLAVLLYFCWQPDEEEDEETREYRKKIEQQKLEREKFLQRKEERRKLAALEKQRELQKDVDVMPGGKQHAPVCCVSRGGCEQFHFFYCVKRSVQRHCMCFLIYSSP